MQQFYNSSSYLDSLPSPRLGTGGFVPNALRTPNVKSPMAEGTFRFPPPPGVANSQLGRYDSGFDSISGASAGYNLDTTPSASSANGSYFSGFYSGSSEQQLGAASTVPSLSAVDWERSAAGRFGGSVAATGAPLMTSYQHQPPMSAADEDNANVMAVLEHLANSTACSMPSMATTPAPTLANVPAERRKYAAVLAAYQQQNQQHHQQYNQSQNQGSYAQQQKLYTQRRSHQPATSETTTSLLSALDGLNALAAFSASQSYPTDASATASTPRSRKVSFSALGLGDTMPPTPVSAPGQYIQSEASQGGFGYTAAAPAPVALDADVFAPPATTAALARSAATGTASGRRPRRDTRRRRKRKRLTETKKRELRNEHLRELNMRRTHLLALTACARSHIDEMLDKLAALDGQRAPAELHEACRTIAAH